MAAAGLLEDDDQRDFMEKHPCIAKALAILLLLAFVPFFCIWGSQVDFPPSEYRVKVPGVEGLERSADAVEAPTFNLTLRVNNEAVSRVVCGRGDRVDVAYEGVPLAHGERPDFCVPPGTVGSVPVVATGDGLGLPDDIIIIVKNQEPNCIFLNRQYKRVIWLLEHFAEERPLWSPVQYRRAPQQQRRPAVAGNLTHPHVHLQLHALAPPPLALHALVQLVGQPQPSARGDDGDRADRPRPHAELREVAVRDRHARIRHVHASPLAAERPEAVVAATVVVDSEGDAEGGRGHRVGAPVEPLDGG
ncbi:hypothetical protein C2845_PM07G24430 [Panicum miliaceum]|uniref:Late embryogenesis abundant protein LEA-2 subgroup domain-containing protein n=1 Tax=Panicum miliaceum TaxID=4540 RepID=A0A3L6SQL5_PANMI|nr:hypothetical protein C2845_PM07G24430 [Panicum miliaceum]